MVSEWRQLMLLSLLVVMCLSNCLLNICIYTHQLLLLLALVSHFDQS